MLVSGEQSRPSSNDLFNIISGRGGGAEGDISYGYIHICFSPSDLLLAWGPPTRLLGDGVSLAVVFVKETLLSQGYEEHDL